MTDTTGTLPILIIGAGISGLSLAQGCRKRGLPFRLFERDASATHRGAGWGLTMNWSLPIFQSLLLDDILKRLPEAYVNRDGVENGDKGTFTFFDLATGEAKWRVPVSGERIRVSRERLRRLLLCHIDVEWEKRLVDVRRETDGVTAVFTDGTEAKGTVLMACDGANSQVRRLCHRDSSNIQLPVRFIGAGVRYSEPEIREMRKLDPFFLQGADSKTDAFLWFSFLNNPTDPSPGLNSDHQKEDDGKYHCQIMMAWPYRAGFRGASEPIDMPKTRAEQLAWMKTLAKGWVEPFRSLVQNMPEGEKECDIMPIILADWLPRRTAEFGGRVVLLGDAAHTMVMFRGEGAQQAIADVSIVLSHIEPLIVATGGRTVDGSALQEAVEKYETEMIERTELAVLASRQACLDANDFKRVNDKSPLVRRRLMRADLEEE